jgi:hypothetical protein
MVNLLPFTRGTPLFTAHRTIRTIRTMLPGDFARRRCEEHWLRKPETG